MARVQAIFFDIGGTLGVVNPTTLKLKPFHATRPLLTGLQSLDVKVGVISNTPEGVNRARVLQMLTEAKLDGFFAAEALMTSVDAGASKPQPGIYAAAAAAVHLKPAECLYIGEDPAEVDGAVAAGMQAILER